MTDFNEILSNHAAAQLMAADADQDAREHLAVMREQRAETCAYRDLPEWAIKQAVDLANAEDHDCYWTYTMVSSSPALAAFARYIALHEVAS